MLKNKLYIFLISLISSYPLYAVEQCEYSVARLVSIEGSVEKLTQNQSKWNPVKHHECFCQGDKIRTLPRSRVKLVFIHEPTTIMELEQNSTMTFPKSKQARLSTDI